MKKIITFSVLILALTKVEAQTKIPVSVNIDGTISKLNFHTRRSECQSGFGFCLLGTFKFNIKIGSKLSSSYVTGDSIKVYGVKTNDKIELHVTDAIAKLAGNESMDYSRFEVADGVKLAVDDGSRVVSFSSSTYPVKHLYNEYIITLPTY